MFRQSFQTAVTDTLKIAYQAQGDESIMETSNTGIMAQGNLTFSPHPNLSDGINHNIVQSEIEGGVFLEQLPPTTVLRIRTQHHDYTAVLLGSRNALISGHPQYCPEPVLVVIAGSTWGGSMLKLRFVGRGMHLEFHHPAYRTPIVTSPIQEIEQCVETHSSLAGALA